MPARTQNINNYLPALFQSLSRYADISEKEFDQLIPLLELRQFGKREEVLRFAQVDDYLNIVVKGLVRKYVLVEKNEKTLQLATEGHIIHSEISFHRRVPSTVIIETIEPTTFVSMRYENVQKALREIPAAETVARQMVTYMFIKKDARYFSQLNISTRERFLNYLKNHPHMLQRVPQKFLASYLEIKPETFSRLKHLLKS